MQFVKLRQIRAENFGRGIVVVKMVVVTVVIVLIVVVLIVILLVVVIVVIVVVMVISVVLAQLLPYSYALPNDTKLCVKRLSLNYESLI